MFTDDLHLVCLDIVNMYITAECESCNIYQVKISCFAIRAQVFKETHIPTAAVALWNLAECCNMILELVTVVLCKFCNKLFYTGICWKFSSLPESKPASSKECQRQFPCALLSLQIRPRGAKLRSRLAVQKILSVARQSPVVLDGSYVHLWGGSPGGGRNRD